MDKKKVGRVLKHVAAHAAGVSLHDALSGRKRAEELLDLYAGVIHSSVCAMLVRHLSNLDIFQKLENDNPREDLCLAWEMLLACRALGGWDMKELLERHAALSTEDLRNEIIGFLATHLGGSDSETTRQRDLFAGVPEEVLRRQVDYGNRMEAAAAELPDLVARLENRDAKIALERWLVESRGRYGGIEPDPMIVMLAATICFERKYHSEEEMITTITGMGLKSDSEFWESVESFGIGRGLKAASES